MSDNKVIAPRKEQEVKERVRTGLRIPYELNTWLILEARKQGISKNALILKILWEWEQEEKEHGRK